LKFELQNKDVIFNKLKAKQDLYQSYYNRTAHRQKEIDVGDHVLINHDTTRNKEWKRGVVINKHKSPRSFIVRDEKGSTVRRNRKHLRKSENKMLVQREVQSDLDGDEHVLNCTDKIKRE